MPAKGPLLDNLSQSSLNMKREFSSFIAFIGHLKTDLISLLSLPQGFERMQYLQKWNLRDSLRIQISPPAAPLWGEMAF